MRGRKDFRTEVEIAFKNIQIKTTWSSLCWDIQIDWCIIAQVLDLKFEFACEHHVGYLIQ